MMFKHPVAIPPPGTAPKPGVFHGSLAWFSEGVSDTYKRYWTLHGGELHLPQIKSFSFSSDLTLGDSVVLTCAVKRGSAGPHTLSWLRDAVPLVPRPRVSVSRPSDVMSILAFENVQPEDVANYTCVAANAHGQHSMTAALLVTAVAPRVRTFSFQEDLSLGDATAVACALRRGSRGHHNVVWKKDSSPELFEGFSGRVIIQRQSDELSVLAIRDIGYEDEGNYTCVASNDHGSDQHTAQLLVSGQR
ncbi:hypothetical protein MRX96_050893 [Rhipicephalus microplus]